MAMKRALALGCPTLLCLTLGAAPLAAHPHVFIDTELVVLGNADGAIIGVEVAWTYDELTSLLVLEDMGLDRDYDGVLTEAELAQLDGFDHKWIEGYAGDLYASSQGAPLDLGPPEGRGVSVADGKITSRHFRALTTTEVAARAAPVILKAFDPTYYTAYDLQGRVTAPEGCAVTITPADLDRAFTLVEEALYVNPPRDDDEFPEVGEAFADTVVVACGG